jgi:hypothetical protein
LTFYEMQALITALAIFPGVPFIVVSQQLFG